MGAANSDIYILGAAMVSTLDLALPLLNPSLETLPRAPGADADVGYDAAHLRAGARWMDVGAEL